MNRSHITIAALVLAAFACKAERNLVTPEEAALKFLSDLQIKFKGKPNCAGVDSDDDGYVTCTVALDLGPDKDGRTLSLQCAGVTRTDPGCSNDGQTNKFTVGCKETLPRLAVPVPGQ